MDANMLRAEIVRNGMTQRTLAKKIGVSESTFIRKMKAGTFGIDEAELMINILGISDPVAVFFTSKVTR